VFTEAATEHSNHMGALTVSRGRGDDRLTGRGRLLPYATRAAAGSTSPARHIRCWPLRAPPFICPGPSGLSVVG